MNKKQIRQMMQWYQELLSDDVGWNKDIRVMNSNPSILLDIKVKDDTLIIFHREMVRIKEGEVGYDSKYVNYRHDEKTETLNFDHERVQIVFNWIESAAKQLLQKLSEEKILELREYLKYNTIAYYSHEVRSLEDCAEQGKYIFVYTDAQPWYATRYSLFELYHSMYRAQHPKDELNRAWTLRNFYKMWITFYPELAVEDDDENSLYCKVENDYWSRFKRGGVESIRKMNWKAFLKKHDPVHYLKVIEKSTQENELRIRKLEAIAKMDDYELSEFHISEFDDDMFGPLGRFPDGCTEISEAQFAKIMMVVQPQIENKEEDGQTENIDRENY